MPPSRRELLAGAVATATVAAAAPLAAAAAPASLQGIAARRGLRFGTAVPWQAGGRDGVPVADPAYAG